MSRNDPQQGRSNPSSGQGQRKEPVRDDELQEDQTREPGRMRTDQLTEEEQKHGQQPPKAKPTGMSEKKTNQPR